MGERETMSEGTLRINVAKVSGALMVLTTLSGGVWATALAHSRLAAAENRAQQHEAWIQQQTVRIERLEGAIADLRVTMGRIDENVIQLRRESRGRTQER